MTVKKNPQANQEKQYSLRLKQQQYDQIKHFADQAGLSVNAWILQACVHMVDYINADYDVPTAMVQRQNQLVDMQQALIQRLNQLIDINVQGFDTMSSIMRGSNYLADDDHDDKPRMN